MESMLKTLWEEKLKQKVEIQINNINYILGTDQSDLLDKVNPDKSPSP